METWMSVIGKVKNMSKGPIREKMASLKIGVSHWDYSAEGECHEMGLSVKYLGKWSRLNSGESEYSTG